MEGLLLIISEPILVMKMIGFLYQLHRRLITDNFRTDIIYETVTNTFFLGTLIGVIWSTSFEPI